MWYVNESAELTEDTVLKGFILTMWYVNLGILKVSSDFQPRFILTMWYVNITFFEDTDFRNKFYINYVVCKCF